MMNSEQVRGSKGTKRDSRLIPIHVRFIPKDIWIRLHIDSRSTIGAVKDAVLEKMNMPPYDPTLLPGFYDEARYAMTRSALLPNEARAFPKAFLARCPKRTVGDVIDVEVGKSKSQAIPDTIRSSPNKFTPRLKGKGSLTLARELIGGDPGEGGMGSLGYVGNVSSLRSQERSQEYFAGDASRRGDHSRLVSSPSSSSTASKLINSVRAVRSPRLRTSMASLSAAAQEVHNNSRFDDLLYDPTVEAGLDAYVDYLPMSLPGNTLAKQKEEEAMLLANTSASTSGEADKTMEGSIGKPNATFRSSPSFSSSFHEPSSTGHADQNELELGDSTTDDESQQSHDQEATSKSLLSSESDTSRVTHPSPLRSKGKSQANSDSSSIGAHSIGLKSPPLERGRSGTIIAVHDPRLASVSMARAASDLSARSSKLALGVVRREHSRRSLPDEAKEQHHTLGEKVGEETSIKTNKRGIVGDVFAKDGITNKIAGIQLDEISAWKDAKHPLSKFFCVYSYSNGHLLEDWRTVAAFRLRPFELLEIQYSDPQERIHLSRGLRESGIPHRPSLQSNVELNSTDNYIAPCCQGWCYIFKRNSGNNKAQRAGLGVWKLRYLVIREPHLIVYRKKPLRSAIHDLQNAMIWNLNTIDCIFSEQADGCTRPALMALPGLSTDILTLTTSAEMAPPAFVNNENSMWATSNIVSLSMRFISQLDSCAFFHTFARATILSQSNNPRRSAWINEWRKKVVTRATIAGRGGSVLPGKAGRNGGRNAIARARLRPPGVSRDFDDVDRWSSHSESEEHDKVKPSKSFNYSDLYGERSGGNQVDQGSPFFDPSYDMRPVTTITSIRTHDSLSPIEKRPDLLFHERVPERQRTISSEVLPKPMASNGGTSAKVGRSRGFSFAKAARKAISPSESLKSPGTPLSSTPLKKSSGLKDVMTDGDSVAAMRRRSLQTGLGIANHPPPDIPSKASAFDLSESTSKTQDYPSSSQSNQNRHFQVSSPTNVKGRNRSYTLSSFTSSSSSSPINFKRSSNSKQTSSSSSGTNQYPFHWPFRPSNTRAATSASSKTDATTRSNTTAIGRGM